MHLQDNVTADRYYQDSWVTAQLDYGSSACAKLNYSCRQIHDKDTANSLSCAIVRRGGRRFLTRRPPRYRDDPAHANDPFGGSLNIYHSRNHKDRPDVPSNVPALDPSSRVTPECISSAPPCVLHRESPLCSLDCESVPHIRTHCTFRSNLTCASAHPRSALRTFWTASKHE